MFNKMKPIYAHSARAGLGFSYLISLLISCKDSEFLIFLILRLYESDRLDVKSLWFLYFPYFQNGY